MSDRTLRWWWMAGIASVAFFAAYISLVPFRFVAPPSGVPLLDFIRTNLETNIGSGSNFAANAVMFMPFGLCGMAIVVDDRSRWWQWGLAFVVVLAAAITLSISIEAAQAFVPGRTPSLSDLVAQTIGTIAGVAVWAVLGREIRQFASTYASGQRRALETVLLLYAAGQFLLLLEPFDVSVEISDLAHKFRSGGIVLNPLHSPTFSLAMLTSMLADVILAVPVGALAAIGGRRPGTRRSVGAALAIGIVFYSAGEFAQCFIRTRTADVVDLVANLLGMGIGVAVAVASTGVDAHGDRADESAPSWSMPATTMWCAGGLIGTALLYAVYNLAPFDFVFSHEMIATRLGRLRGVPFFGYYQNPEFKALRDLFVKLGLALPFGLLYQIGFEPEQSAYRRTLIAVWLVATAAFFSVVELGQVFLPSRYPDDTDIIIATAGVWIGVRIARPFAARRGAVGAPRDASS
ncbi:MAG: VanZ family protein [Vicinamibacterales bacterium]